MLILKVLLYTGIRVIELINIQLIDVHLTNCRIKINQGKGKKDRVVPFSPAFKETLALHIKQYKNENRLFLFESGFRRHYTDRGVRKILMRYTKLAGIERSISPHKLRHFLFTWLKKKNIDDAFIQPYSGHAKEGRTIGRGITLYEELHEKQYENNPKIHPQFLEHLKKVIPSQCKPVIVTDAGFKNPWFKAVINEAG
ncbi:tyrosine-type recombinase/integrase [Legionella bozemanae]|uniref:tyrosine-type recombinase/integrase n=1 Tax=Legionella bozemanae TaxID=447 RepID=UPI00216AEC34|nr:tyrosine-type recombinase/integrase [Legionella bozemanae]